MQPMFCKLFCLTVMLLAFCGGCGSSLNVAQVDGVLLINGKPGDKIRVEFHPEYVEGQKTGPTSTADTDKDGKFTLQLQDRQGGVRPGAMVGKHRVTLYDLQRAASPTGLGVPIRVPAEWAMAGSTPLTKEVKAGQQTIEIKVPE